MKALFAALVILTFMACRKDDLDVADLTTNPFDPDYVGPALFEKEAERTIPYQVGDVTFLRLDVDVRVRTERLPSSAAYGVSYRVPGASSNVNVPTADLADDRFTMSVLEVTASRAYCVEVALTNGGGAGGGNVLCATAE